MQQLKKVAAINDLSGASRCSLTVAIPVLACMGIQCCALPTAVLSNHTGYADFYFDDYTRHMRPYLQKWASMGLMFDYIYTGFLGSGEQIDIALECIRQFRTADTHVLVDPVMGDDGQRYATYTPQMCEQMRRLVGEADVATPNVTEACLLADVPYTGETLREEQVLALAREIAALGVKNVVITGVKQDGKVCNYVYAAGRLDCCCAAMAPVYYSGTGDLFASIVCGCLTQGKDLFFAVQTATQFIAKAAALSCAMGIPPLEGVCFEQILKELTYS